MDFLRRWRMLLLLLLGILGSALLCLALAQNLFERQVRMARQSALEMQRDARLTLMRAQIERVTQLLSVRTSGPAPAGISLGPGLAPLVSGLLWVNPQNLTVVQSTLSDMPTGHVVADEPGVQSLRAVKSDANPILFITEDAGTGWLSVLSASAESVSEESAQATNQLTGGVWLARLDLSELLNLSEYVQRPAPGEVASESASASTSTSMSLPVRIRADLRLTPSTSSSAASVASAELSVSVVVPGTTPEVSLTISAPEPALLETIAPLYSRVLIGSGLVALVLGGLFWRWLRGGAASVSPAIGRVLRAVDAGDLSVRTGLTPTADQDGSGRALDSLLDRHANLSESSQREQAELTASVTRIAGAVNTMSQTRDLTHRVPSTVDMTGAIAEAVNTLGEQTAEVFGKVKHLSQAIAGEVTGLGTRATRFDELSQQQSSDLSDATTRMMQASDELKALLSDHAQAGDSVLAASESTDAGALAAQQTLSGLEQARRCIRQAEKRLKSLGERAQEISGAVTVIADLAERTGIVALNASLQAAAAGQAGRQFAPIADEVKRLADSASDATVHVARLVRAVRDDTRQTTEAMNEAIAGVVDVTARAEKSLSASQDSGDTVRALQTSLSQMAESATMPGKTARSLQEQMNRIRESGDLLVDIMTEQADGARQLNDYVRDLLDQADSFTVDGAAEKPK